MSIKPLTHSIFYLVLVSKAICSALKMCFVLFFSQRILINVSRIKITVVAQDKQKRISSNIWCFFMFLKSNP